MAEITPEQFWDMCQSHDWHYAMSDDPRVFSRGEMSARRLRVAASSSERLGSIFEAWYDHVHSGPAYGTIQAPRPERPAP